MRRLSILSLPAQLLLLIGSAVALDIDYCSAINTGSDVAKGSDTYQSNGACAQACRSEYAFAIIKGNECWCSNYAPGESTSTSYCDEKCPGFPQELCGSSFNNLFAYFQLSRPPSGIFAPVAEKDNDQLETSDPVPASAEQPTVTVTEQETLPAPSSDEPPPATSETSEAILETHGTTPSPNPTSAFTSTTFSVSVTSYVAIENDNVIASVVTVTQEGRTIVSTSRTTPTEDVAVGESSSDSGGTQPGPIAGIAIGTAAGIAGILGAVFWGYRRRRQSNQASPSTPQSYESDSPQSLPRRHASQMSQAGLIDKNPRITATGLPGGSGGNSAGTSVSQPNRYSAGTDLRLNPSALYVHEESQHSSVSLQDNRDYSRQLQVRNPDS